MTASKYRRHDWQQRYANKKDTETDMEQNMRELGALTQFKSGEIAAERGRAGGHKKGENAQRRRDLLALFGVEPLSAAMVKTADSVLLAMNTEQLKVLAADEDMPVYLRRRARLLLQQDDSASFETAERMLDRAFGKPKQAVVMDVAQKPPIMVLPDEVEDITADGDEGQEE